jgi:hypothetical protein
MINLKPLSSVLGSLFVIACVNSLVLAQTNEDRNQIAAVSGSTGSVRFDVAAPNSGVTLTVLGPDGQIFSKKFQAGNSPEFRLNDAIEKLPDGTYTYELRLTPIFSAEVKEALKAARAKGNEAEVLRDLRRRGALPSQATVQSGSFLVVNGTVVVGGGPEKGDQDRAMVQQPPSSVVASASSTVSTATPTVSTGRSSYKIPRHHPSLPFFDFVIADDLIVQGSTCSGLDCVNGENFGFDTIRVKENNTRIQFDDTSASAGFATNNWQIRANSSANGGANFLAFVDQGAAGNSETGTIVFQVSAGAPANSLFVSSIGNVGVGTATPVLDVHVNTTDTPAVRLEQNNTGGFTAQTWDVAGNEANFFVRDVTSGSLLPFRIRPGAPTSSVDISANGNVGIGIASPSQRLHAHGAAAGLPATNGTVQNGIARFSQATGTGVVDLGFGGVSGTGWIQATNSANLATNFGLLLNPNGGNVGIGTIAPTQTLSVNGTAGKPGGGSWDVFSDERLKKINGPFNSGLKAVMQLQPIRYEYKANNSVGIKSEGEHIGFGAQSIQRVIPEAVTTASNGFLMVNNDPIIWTMLNAIKEQQKEIVELKRQIRQLRASTRRRR